MSCDHASEHNVKLSRQTLQRQEKDRKFGAPQHYFSTSVLSCFASSSMTRLKPCHSTLIEIALPKDSGGATAMCFEPLSVTPPCFLFHSETRVSAGHRTRWIAACSG